MSCVLTDSYDHLNSIPSKMKNLFLIKLCVISLSFRYKGWLDAVGQIWRKEGPEGFFRGSVPRVMWYIPASALTFMAVEFLRDNFREKGNSNNNVVSNLSIERKTSSSSVREVGEN